MSVSGPVGVFDSGVGGLSVAREIRALLPAEELLYLADTAYCPYGGRPLEQIRARSLLVGNELVARGAKLLVVACNSASGAALEVLREQLPVSVVGLEPALKPAIAGTKRGRVGVLATEATLKTERFERLIEDYANGKRVVARACPGLVELVEEGRTHGQDVREVLAPLLAPLQEEDVDVVVLGCTHYPLLRDAIAELMGPGVQILDSGAAVARQVKRVLQENDLLASGTPGKLRLLTTGDAAEVGPIAERLWMEELLAESITI